MQPQTVTSRAQRLIAAVGFAAAMLPTAGAQAQSWWAAASSGAYMGSVGGTNDQVQMYFMCSSDASDRSSNQSYFNFMKTTDFSVGYNFGDQYAYGSVPGIVGTPNGSVVAYNGLFYGFAQVGGNIYYAGADPTQPQYQTITVTKCGQVPSTALEGVGATVLGRSIYAFTMNGSSVACLTASALVQNTNSSPQLNCAWVPNTNQLGTQSPWNSPWTQVLTAITIGSQDAGTQRALVIINDEEGQAWSAVFDPAAAAFLPNSLAPVMLPMVPGDQHGVEYDVTVRQASGIQATADGVIEMSTLAMYPVISSAGTVLLFASGVIADPANSAYSVGAEYSLATNTWTPWPYTIPLPAPQIGYPFWPVACAPFYAADPSGNLQQYISLALDTPNNDDIVAMLLSDVFVPLATPQQMQANPWDTADASLYTTEQATIVRMMWKVIGIVMGVPPYMANGKDPDEDVIASLQIGQSGTTTVNTQVTESQTFGVGSDTTIGGKHCKNETDISATQGQSSTQGKETDITESLGYGFDNTNSSNGTFGWMLYKAPVIEIQDYQSVQYGYSGDPTTSSPNGYDMYLFTSTAMEFQTATFDLQNPAGPNSEPPAELFAGIQPVPYSTDVDDWQKYNNTWGAPGTDPVTKQPLWSIVAGASGPNIVNTLSAGSAMTESYCQTNTSSQSNDVSNEQDISNQTTIKVPFFKEQASVSFTDSMDQSGAVSTSIDRTVQTSLNIVNGGSTPGYLASLTVQPWLLQATSYNAPWVPEDYFGPLPWCFTWSTFGVNVNPSTSAGGTAAFTSGPREGQYAFSPRPSSMRVSVRGLPSQYAGRQTLAGKLLALKAGFASAALNGINPANSDSFLVNTGKLATVDKDGKVAPIAMTATEFDPVKGAIITLRGIEFKATAADGRWRRSGTTWSFASSNRNMSLSLDFRRFQWNASVAKVGLGKKFADMDPNARVAPRPQRQDQPHLLGESQEARLRLGLDGHVAQQRDDCLHHRSRPRLQRRRQHDAARDHRQEPQPRRRRDHWRQRLEQGREAHDGYPQLPRQGAQQPAAVVQGWRLGLPGRPRPQDLVNHDQDQALRRRAHAPHRQGHRPPRSRRKEVVGREDGPRLLLDGHGVAG